MSDLWTDRLSEYLDGELPAATREALERHLEECASCAAVLDELRAVAARARSLDDRPPVRDLWSGVAARIGAAAPEAAPAPRARVLRFPRVTLSLPQLAAAAVVLVIVSGAVAIRWNGSPAPAPGPGLATDGAPIPAASFAAAPLGGARYDSAVVDLERAVADGRDRLDSVTVRVIEENLAIIDQAIAQARAALAADPGSLYLNNHLAGTLKRKIDLLQRVSRLAAVRS